MVFENSDVWLFKENNLHFMKMGMRGSREFCQIRSNLIFFFFFFTFLVDEDGGSKYHFKQAIIGTPVKRH